MRRALLTRCIVPLAAIALAFAFASAPAAGAGDREPSFVVIVHPDNPVTSIDREFLRDAYLKKATDWDDGKTIRPVDLSSKFSARDRFERDVIEKTPSQLKSYWNQQIFSGKGVPPPEAPTTDQVIAYVLANPGAVGYLPAGVDPGRAKAIEVK